MSPIRCFLLCLALTACARTAVAHDIVPADWCVDENAKPERVASFKFDGGQIRDVMAKCGILEGEDHFHTVANAMGEWCRIVAPRQDAMPFISGPSSFIDKDHHARYRIDDGITGICAVCVRPSR
ncbi:hypothetical protein ABB28_03945 [Stenotrophomonas chelatiphaga]|uniref:Lipoprotein n=1 Tax=Stenotrophomonas chelatiphaga TaxID=517011 RepID=A0A0R0DFD0_9GAMM|nr:hypothetical protein [Stenotrophomonas chelatiphaga]KRG76099.1 hypothetical protein ABB28_03945 [Stenotrophomonas chelatiphaga]